jgi:Helix-turn-helix domain
MPMPECHCVEAAYKAGLADAATAVQPTPELAAQVAQLLGPWLETLAQPAQGGGRKLLSITEAAGQLGVSRSQAYSLVYTGDLASVEMPPGRRSVGKARTRKVELAEVDAFIKRNRVTGGVTTPGAHPLPGWR